MIDSNTVATVTNNKRSLPHLIRLLVGAGLLLILLWVGLKTWRIIQATQSLLEYQTQLETLAAADPIQIDPQLAETTILGVRQELLTIKTETAPFLPLTPYLGWLPRVGPVLTEAPQLLAIADAGTEAAAYAIRGLKPALQVLQTDSDAEAQLPELIRILEEAQPDLQQTSLALERLATAQATIENPEALPWRVRTLLTQAQEWLPLAQDGLQLAQVLPQMGGLHGPRRYLLLAQNEDELRATGGFISGAGLIVVENGRIVSLNFQDASKVDNWQEKPYELLTDGPLFLFMDLRLAFFRDANMWPDFPTSAEAAMDLYSYGQDLPPLDGVIAIDQRFLQLLLEATGPVPIPDEAITINSKNVISHLRQAWAIQEDEGMSEWLQTRKSFLGTFSGALQEKIMSDFTSIDPVQLVTNLNKAVQAKHLQIYMRDPAVAAVLADIQWDGRLTIDPNQDTLLIIDTNVGYNKANLFVERAVDYQVTLHEDGGGQAHLQLTYTHATPDNGNPCQQGIPYKEVTAYLQIAERCYWNYLRVYVPGGSQLLDASQHHVPQETMWHTNDVTRYTAETLQEMDGLTTFTNFFLLPRGDHLTTTHTYQLPTTITHASEEQQRYQLAIFKQAGTRPEPVHVTLTLPDNTILVKATPEPTAVTGVNVSFELTLDANKFITVSFKNN